ncbi:hypothetical protein WME90_35005 [Sorangium sp. So ce375]|uniref:hypothetical protein n=1 Tax=Sorangium sp. So ce375 TaxID=3133306 RepID=UPI003F5BE5A8
MSDLAESGFGHAARGGETPAGCTTSAGAYGPESNCDHLNQAEGSNATTTPLTGRIVNGRAEFAFMALEYRYAADTFVAKSGDRMAGRFHGVSSWYGPTAWLRIDPSQRWLAHDKRLGTALREHQGSYDLTLDPSSAPGDAFSTDRSYALSLGVNASPLIFGDLGAFWASEMAWREPTLTIGPVPATHPELPVALELRFRDTVLHEVTATMPEGERYVFTAAPTP